MQPAAPSPVLTTPAAAPPLASTSEAAAFLATGLLAFGAATLAWWAAGGDAALVRWGPFLAFGLALGAAVAVAWTRPRTIVAMPVPAWLPLAAAGVAMLLAAAFVRQVGLRLPTQPGPLKSLSPVLAALVALGSFGLAAWTLERDDAVRTRSPAQRAGAVVVCGLIALAGWAAFAEYRGAYAMALEFAARPWVLLLGAAAAAAATIACLDGADTGPHERWLWHLLAAVTLAGSAVLALRSDRLFDERAEQHWEFFVASVRAVRDGGLLLWDTPSQYGFLNILLASWIPAPTSWQAFYLFQAGLLLVVAAVVYLTLVRLLPVNIFTWLFATATTLLLFTADPGLMGPQPFPSTSVVRFATTYFLLAWFFLQSRRDAHAWLPRRAHWGGIALWLLGVFWSAESAVYTTTVFAAGSIALFACLHGAVDAAAWRRKLRAFGADTAIGLVACLVVLCAVYLARIGHLPDFAAFFVYGLSYAAGFGSFPVSLYGPMWTLVLPLFLLGAWTVHAAWRKPLAPSALCIVPAAAALWATLSYYVGRAVPDNLVALFPLVLFALGATVHAVPRGPTPVLRAALLVFTANLLAFALASTVLQARMPRVLAAFHGYVPDVAQQLPPATPELQALLRQAGVDARQPVVMHGTGWVMLPLQQDGRKQPFEATWLPGPMAMLEEPVPPARREAVLARFMARKRVPGYIVQARGEFEDRLQEWQALLEKTHTVQLAGESPHWRLYRCVPR